MNSEIKNFDSMCTEYYEIKDSKHIVVTSVYHDKYGNKITEVRDFKEGRCTHYKNSNNVEYWSEYDSRGNEIHRKYKHGLEWRSVYDLNGNRIIYSDSYGNIRINGI